MSDEHWKPVVGYEGLYEVSTLGNVRSLRRSVPRMMSSTLSRYGYHVVNLRRDGRSFTHQVSNLVLAAFVGPSRGLTCNHKDGNKVNNRAENLEWVTRAENLAHAWRTGLLRNYGERNHLSKLTERSVREIRRRRKAGESLRDIATTYEVTVGNISAICCGKSWKQLL